MFGIEVEFLSGKIYASDRSIRNIPEWPPHPNRLFSGLVATAHECGMGNDALDALKWLEEQRPPSLWANPSIPSSLPESPVFWVPVNNDHAKSSGSPVKTGFPLLRKKAERYFPSFFPETSYVYFIWEHTEGKEAARHKHTLSKIAENLSYLGHSSSPVRACVRETGIPEATLIPQKDGEITLRVPGPGRLTRLKEVFEASTACKRRIEPPLGLFCRYALRKEHAGDISAGPFRVAAIFRKLRGNVLPFEALGTLSSTVRKTLFSLIPDPIPEILSGHKADGSPSKRNHLAISPLGNVGHPYADGHLMGFALLVPRHIDEREELLLGEALTKMQKLWMGKAGEWTISRCDTVNPFKLPKNLLLRSLTGPSRTWATVTPMAFGHYPKDKDGKRGEDLVLRYCSRSGLPKPLSITWREAPFLQGPVFARELQKSHPQVRRQFLAHVNMRFNAPLKGPLLLGAGKYIGFGLFLPFFQEEVPS